MANAGKGSSPAARRARAVESFGNAADAIGKVEAGMALFAVTRGQWSMIDAVLHVLDQVGPAAVSLWTWTVAEYEVEVLGALMGNSRATSGRLVIDGGARKKNAEVIANWQRMFGADSVRYVVNHAKIATVASKSGLRVLLRGSMNLNHNPRFEQFDITEGGPDFDLVQSIEEALPVLGNDCVNAQTWAASKLSGAFTVDEMSEFRGARTWAK